MDANAPQEIMDAADLVTEMKEIKHYYNKGIPPESASNTNGNNRGHILGKSLNSVVCTAHKILLAGEYPPFIPPGLSGWAKSYRGK
jgi:hypothetical protein